MLVKLPELPSLDTVREKLTRAVALKESLQERLDSLEGESRGLKEKEQILLLVGELFRNLVDLEISDAVNVLKKLQTRGLQVVFADKDLFVDAEVLVKRGKVSLDFITCERDSDGTIVKGSVKSFGGSVTTLQSILLRIIVILRRKMRLVLFLDEAIVAFYPDYV